MFRTRLAVTAAAALALGLAVQVTPAQAAPALADHTMPSGQNCAAPADWTVNPNPGGSIFLIEAKTGDARVRCNAFSTVKAGIPQPATSTADFTVTETHVADHYVSWTGVLKASGNIVRTVALYDTNPNPRTKADLPYHVAEMTWYYPAEQAGALTGTADSSFGTFIETFPYAPKAPAPNPTAAQTTKPAEPKATRTKPAPADGTKPGRGVEAKTGVEEEVPVVPASLLAIAVAGGATAALRRKR